MAAFTFNHAKHLLGQGAINLATADFRVKLLMTNTTVDTEDDATNLGEFTTIDQMDGSGYADVATTGEVWAKDAPNNRSELDVADTVFPNLGAGTRQVQAALLYIEGATDADRIPCAYYDGGGFPFDATGSDVTIEWDQEGILQIR